MTIKENLPMVFLRGGPLDGFRRNLEARDLEGGEPPEKLAAIPGHTDSGAVIRPPLPPPPSISHYVRTDERLDAIGKPYVYEWRQGEHG